MVAAPGDEGRPSGPPLVGVLALQGASALHLEALRALGAEAVEVRTPEELAGVDALVLPGGESTTISMMLERNELFEPLAERLAAGMPAFGTCAGMILLATTVLDGRPDQRSFSTLPISVRRNGFGRQVDSFETDLDVAGLDTPFHGVFIRAPRIVEASPEVEVLAHYDGEPVLVRHGRVMAASFHPELGGDVRVHATFLQEV